MTSSPALKPSPVPSPARPRLESVDLLRGLVMVVMALDHTRDFLSNITFSPTDLAHTYPALYFTRWITHFCAPAFTFLAGTGAFLATTRGQTKSQISGFLFTRGLWLVILELTWVRCLGWEFNFHFQSTDPSTLWAIGWSMVVLAALVQLPTWLITAFGVGTIALHNAFDSVKPESLGGLEWLWRVLHVNGPLFTIGGHAFNIGYPLVPWIGVTAVGYAFGVVLTREAAERNRIIRSLGALLTLLFVAVRFTNLYGDPKPWVTQPQFLLTLFSFLDCQKYPPSLLYLLMTLGPMLIALSLLDLRTPRWLKPALVLGRVPLFYYLLHLPLIHLVALLLAYFRYGRAEWLLINPNSQLSTDLRPSDYGFDLPVVYLVWIGVVVALYPLCRWFAELKRRRRDAWLSYL